ncbi:MAG: discoidin domain-containing protein [Clostridia bacterium]|nr:discoidin domain-containing protein [Clostridia bacterium]
MKNRLFYSILSTVLIASMIMPMLFSGSVFADASELKEPPVYYDFDDMTIGEQLYDGTVTEYKGNKMLKQELDPAGRRAEFYAMIPGDAVFSFDFAVTGGPIEGKMTFESGNEAGHALTFTLDGNVISYNDAKITKYDEEVKNIAVVFKANQQHFDIYVNGKCALKGCFTKIRFDKIVNVELYFRAPGEKADIYLDNIMAYPTYEKIRGAMIYDPDAKPVWDKKITLTDKTWFIDEKIEYGFMEDKVSVHMRSGVVCVKNKKTILENMPYVNGDELMVPAEFFKTAYGITPSVSDTTVTLKNNIVLDLKSPKITVGNKTYDIFCSPQEKDGVMYLPLRAIVEKGMSKYIYHDTTAIHYGMVIISDVQIDPKTGDDLQNLNDYCFYVRPTKEQWLADYNASPLKGQHPRVMATEEDFERLKKEIETNDRKKAWFENLIAYCDARLEEPPLKYELRDGIRLMYVSDDFMNWSISFSFAYKITGDKKYLDAAWKQIEAVAAFPDWNPIHHIDVGIMALGFGVSYDWLYHDLTAEQRAIMERAVYNNLYWIINEAQQSFDTVYGDAGMKDNHNVYCNAGVIACIIAFMDVYPEVGSQLGANTMRLLERFLWLFAPLGAYFEGPSYASISIYYTVRLFAAMEPCMGTLYGLDKAEAFDLSADYIMNMQSDAASYGFANGDSGLKRCSGMLWIYNHYGIKGKKEAVADLVADSIGMNAVDALLHYNVEPESIDNDVSGLGIYYSGEDLVLARNSFDPGQVYAGLKCGGTIHAHSHLDSGSFIFDAMGTRWAHDLGADDYNLQYEWDTYEIFRRRPESHNTLIINPDAGYGYELDGSAKFISYDIKPKGVIAKTDLTELYGDKVTSAKRGFFFTDDRRSLVVRDEVALTGKSDLYWLMCINSDAEIVDKNTVILTKTTNASQKVKVEFISSTGEGTIEVGPAAPFPTSPQIPEQNQNKGYYRLSYKVSGNGNINITAKITPMGFDGSDISEYDKNMDSWVIPEGEMRQVPVLDSLTINGETYNPHNAYYTVRVTTIDSPVPEVVAKTDKYIMDIHYAKDLFDQTTIKLTDPNDETNTVTYKISFIPTITSDFIERKFDDYTALTMNNVKASSVLQEENPAEHVLDGDISTRWVSEYTAWLMFDLESEQEFDTVLLAMYLATTRTHTFTIDISNDGKTFTQVGTFTNSGTTDDYEAFDIGPQKARYVRINFRGANNGESYNSVTEFVVAKKK